MKVHVVRQGLQTRTSSYYTSASCRTTQSSNSYVVVLHECFVSCDIFFQLVRLHEDAPCRATLAFTLSLCICRRIECNDCLGIKHVCFSQKISDKSWKVYTIAYPNQIEVLDETKSTPRVGSESSRVGAELTELPSLLTNPLTEPVGEVANLLQRSRKEASVVEVEAEAEDEVEAVAMDEVGIPTAATSTTTRKEKAQQEAVGEAIQTRGTINLKEEPSLTIEVRVSSSSAIPLIRKVTSYTTRTTKSL
ncbi:hypothetical protein ACOSQ3_022433 [Xanthoceras sorbifolium]